MSATEYKLWVTPQPDIRENSPNFNMLIIGNFKANLNEF